MSQLTGPLQIMMSPFSRPLLARSPLVKIPACSRFYTTASTQSWENGAEAETCLGLGEQARSEVPRLVRRHEVQSRIPGRPPPGSGDKVEKYGRPIRERIIQLSQSRALDYPRIGCQEPRPSSAAEFLRKYQDHNMDFDVLLPVKTRLNGRIMNIRVLGNRLCFLTLREGWSEVQIMLGTNFMLSAMKEREEPVDEWKFLAGFKAKIKLFKRGDIVSAVGYPKKMENGKVALAVETLPEILTPSVYPIPFKVLETHRLRVRHLDLLLNRWSSDTLLLRSMLLRKMREFFDRRSFVEVSTPILATNATGAAADPFETVQADNPHTSWALRISPELWLKRLIVGGFDRVYEIGPAFRNEGQDNLHNPEFTMCEFYQAYTSLDDLMLTTEQLLTQIVRHLAGGDEENLKHRLAEMPREDIINIFWKKDAYPEVKSTYPEIEFLPTLEKILGIQFKKLELYRPGGLERLVNILAARGTFTEDQLRQAGTMSKILDLLSEKFLEKYHQGRPFFIKHHPAILSPLSKWFMCSKTGVRVAARAELFYNGIELANMYEEENDPFEQRQKLMARLSRKEDVSAWTPTDWSQTLKTSSEVEDEGESEDGSSFDVPSEAGLKRPHELVDSKLPIVGKPLNQVCAPEPHPDEQYIETLLMGMPPTGGWGCGIDRLVMVFSESTRISNTLSFGSLRHVKAVSERSRFLWEQGKRVDKKPDWEKIKAGNEPAAAETAGLIEKMGVARASGKRDGRNEFAKYGRLNALVPFVD